MHESATQPRSLRLTANALLGALCSVRLAVGVLVLLAIVSAVGALIPQNAGHDQYVELYGDYLAVIFGKTGMIAVFSSWWFLALIAYLVVSMSACVSRRLPAVLHLLRESPAMLADSQFRDSPYFRDELLESEGGLSAAAVIHRTAEALRRHRYGVAPLPAQDEAHRLIAAKGRAGLFGPILVHFSLILITLGGVWTATGSYSYFLSIAVGESSPLPDTPYVVTLHDFVVKYYEGTDRPSEYTSVLSMAQHGQAVGDGSLTVNRPLTLAGVSFFQMRYNPTVSDVTVTVADSASGVTIGEYRLPLGQATHVEELGSTLEPTDFLPDFALTTDGVAVSRTANFSNPAVRLKISTPDDRSGVSRWAFQLPSKLHASQVGGHAYTLKDYTRRTISGIKVVRDRAVPVVYFGFVLLAAGTFLSCYVFHRTVWVAVSPTGSQMRLMVAGRCNRNILEFQHELDQCIANARAADSSTGEAAP